MNNQELEIRLVNFSVEVTNMVVHLRKHPVVIHLKDQIIRSGTAVSLNYGEAQSAESKKDFIHKISIVMKELRETQINLTIISKLNIASTDDKLKELLAENDELLAIFFVTLQTARKRMG